MVLALANDFYIDTAQVLLDLRLHVAANAPLTLTNQRNASDYAAGTYLPPVGLANNNDPATLSLLFTATHGFSYPGNRYMSPIFYDPTWYTNLALNPGGSYLNGPAAYVGGGIGPGLGSNVMLRSWPGQPDAAVIRGEEIMAGLQIGAAGGPDQLMSTMRVSNAVWIYITIDQQHGGAANNVLNAQAWYIPQSRPFRLCQLGNNTIARGRRACQWADPGATRWRRHPLFSTGMTAGSAQID